MNIYKKLRTEQKYDLYKDDYSIPFQEVRKMLETLDYGSAIRIALEFIALTGARISEIENTFLTSFYGDVVVWKPRKGQKGVRRERLPNWFMQELDYYIEHERHAKGLKLFGFNANALNRYFNVKIRPNLSENWRKKRPVQRGSMTGFEYIYQVKGLRHNAQTLDFARNMDKYGKEVAIEFTSRKWKHSSFKINARNYIQNFDTLEINRYKHLTMAEIIKQPHQTRLLEFIE